MSGCCWRHRTAPSYTQAPHPVPDPIAITQPFYPTQPRPRHLSLNHARSPLPAHPRPLPLLILIPALWIQSPLLSPLLHFLSPTCPRSRPLLIHTLAVCPQRRIFAFTFGIRLPSLGPFSLLSIHTYPLSTPTCPRSSCSLVLAPFPSGSILTLCCWPVLVLAFCSLVVPTLYSLIIRIPAPSDMFIGSYLIASCI